MKPQIESLGKSLIPFLLSADTLTAIGACVLYCVLKLVFVMGMLGNAVRARIMCLVVERWGENPLNYSGI